jgi:hypothetical protein
MSVRYSEHEHASKRCKLQLSRYERTSETGKQNMYVLGVDKAEIGDIAEAYGRKLEEAAKSKTANRGNNGSGTR